jgi:hypothetical protein
MGKLKKTTKKSKSKEKKKAPTEKKERKDPRIQEMYYEEVTFVCPIRGLVKQKVKVKRFKPLNQQDPKYRITAVNELTEKLDSQDDGMSIYSDGEELGIATTGGDSE